MDLATLIQLELLRTLGARREDESAGLMPATEGGARGVERSLKTLHAMKSEVRTRPQAVISEFVQKVKEQMGVYPGQVWAFSDYNRRIVWGRHKTLQKLHFLLSEVWRRLWWCRG